MLVVAFFSAVITLVVLVIAEGVYGCVSNGRKMRKENQIRNNET